MKYIILTISLFFYTNIFSQIIIDIEDKANYPQIGYYYKDINNILNPFIGEYIYTSGNTSFKIVLEKKIQSSMNNHYYEDMLIGAYQYVENGTEKVNTLNELNIFKPNGIYYSIDGNLILTGNDFGETTLLPNEKWIRASIKDPISRSTDVLYIRKITTDGGQEAIKIFIYHHVSSRHVNAPIPPPISYPIGQEFILIKQ